MSEPAPRHDGATAAASVADRLGEGRDPSHASAAHALRSRVIAPELAGTEGAIASARVRAQGLHPICHHVQVAASARSGHVLAQIPTAGSEVSADEPIAILIATTSAPGRSASGPPDGNTQHFGDWPEPTSEAARERPTVPISRPTDERGPAARCSGPLSASVAHYAPFVRPTRTLERSRQPAVIGLVALAVLLAVGIAVNPSPTSRSAQRGVATPDAAAPAMSRPSLRRRSGPPSSPATERAVRSARPASSLRRTAPARRTRGTRHASRATQAPKARRRKAPAASRPTRDRAQTPASPPPPSASPSPPAAAAAPRETSPSPLPPGPECF